MAEPYYTTPDELRTELGVDTATLDDAAATRVIELAEDITDELLGAWVIDEPTGRKIVEADVEAWQWAKLGRFTLLLAAKLHNVPGLADGHQWTSESGPDFSHSGPMGSPIGAGLLAVLNQSQLRRLTGRARGGPRSPLVDAFFKASPTWRL